MGWHVQPQITSAGMTAGRRSDGPSFADVPTLAFSPDLPAMKGLFKPVYYSLSVGRRQPIPSLPKDGFFMTQQQDPLRVGAKFLGLMKLEKFCPRCYWFRLHCGNAPFSAFPGIFNSLDAF